ncbi:MAG: HNH endonuclease [Chitinophagaceae bacterium]|nr:MAG: HNH endonuclease [Chitinophagaceae bacterium]
MKVVECTYKGERYSVRENGEVLRHSRPEGRLRSHDNQWTFGKVNANGYLTIGTEVVHRIVATAFLGAPPSSQHIVDHIDTNRQNNRPENLRWLTKLENALLNPITAKRISIVCGSVEAFLENPSAFRDKFTEPNFIWMSHVSQEEAQTSLARLLAWAKSDRPISRGSLGQWVFNRAPLQIGEGVPEVEDLVMAKTLNAAQRNWRTPSEFPCCPQMVSKEPLAAYADALKEGAIFCRNEFNSYKVHKRGLSGNGNSICIMAEPREDAVKPWALTKITYENGLFVHTGLGTFFSEVGAEKTFCTELGLEPPIEDCIDDYC